MTTKLITTIILFSLASGTTFAAEHREVGDIQEEQDNSWLSYLKDAAKLIKKSHLAHQLNNSMERLTEEGRRDKPEDIQQEDSSWLSQNMLLYSVTGIIVGYTTYRVYKAHTSVHKTYVPRIQLHPPTHPNISVSPPTIPPRRIL